MRFADPHTCPSCGGALTGGDRCRHCQLVLNSAAALRLWQTLIQADALLEQARAVAAGASVPASAPIAPMPVVPPPSMPVSPQGIAPGPARKWSTGSVILGLGALCLIVAAFVFITVSWDVLGPTGRTLVLLAITSLVALAAAWATRGRLRASAESLWSIFFGLLTIDFFAAREYGLLGLDTFDGPQAGLVYGLSATVFGAAVVLFSRKTLPLVAPSIVAGLAVWLAAFSLAATVDRDFFWSVLAGLAFSAVATAAAWRLRLKLTAMIAGVSAVFLYVAAWGGAIDELASSPKLAELTRDAHGVPMVVMIVLTAAVGVAFSRLSIPASALVTLGSAALIFTPAEADSFPEGAFIAGSAIVVVLAVALIRGVNGWVRGARIATLMMLGLLTLSTLGWLGNAVDAIADSGDDRDITSWTVTLHNSDVPPGPGWLALIAFAAIAVAVFAALSWPELHAFAQNLMPLPFLVGVVGIPLALIAFEPTVLLAALLVLALGIGFLVLVRSQHEIWLGVALLVVITPAAMTFASQPVTLVVWLAVAAVLVAVARLFEPGWAQRASAFIATGLLIGASVVAADMTPWDVLWIRIVVVVVSLAALAVADFGLRRFAGRLEIEIAAGLGILGTLISAVPESLTSQALLHTIAGGVLVVFGLLVADRHTYRVAGSVLLGIAWVMRLAASEVETVEAYTAPFAVVLLGTGLLAMRRNPQLRTLIALTPGLTLALLPSLPQALDEPTGLRALLLGLVSLVALGVGVWRGWKMPFLFGSAISTLLVLWNLGPLANGLPRWILIATAGVILVGSGITWESRVRNARSAAQYVQNLR